MVYCVAEPRRRACATTIARSVFAAVGLLLGTAPAFAIPSPELVVGSLSSISQLVALVSALLGGGAAVMGLRARSKGGLSRGVIWSVVGLIVVLASAVGGLFYLYMDMRADRTARLEATLTRPMPSVGGRALDPTLKEVSYGDQLKHPRGINTDELEKLLEARARGERPDTILLDIRETAEAEMGGLPGSTPVRFPDLTSSKIDFTGKTAILYCHNGNRGYETCMAMAARGIDCRFMVGGLEKWLVERRSLTGLQARTLDDLRALPPYRNQTVLLDTPDVRKLVDNDGAIFVDVRYPGEFASSHLPGAINLPIRPTPTEQLKAHIQQIPKKPIIIPCYDRRSCFFSEVLGLELDRAGYDYRGKYTVPWEYFIPNTPRPYIEQWRAEASKSWWTKGSEALAAFLLALGKYIGFFGAVLLLALVSRLLVLPFSLKAERDQIRSQVLASELKALKARLKHDPKRLARGIQAFYRRHGFTPLRNLVALLFLPVMAISVTAVHEAATKTPGGFLWMPDLADRDPWLVLPILFAALITLYIDLAFARTSKQRAWIWLISLPVLTATGTLLSVAADIYLIASAVLLLAQRALVTGQLERLREFVRNRRQDTGVVPLSDAARLTNAGNKAYRLARLHADGIAVPDGVVLTSRFLTAYSTATSEWRQRELDRLWRQLGAERVAVRSSAVAEDGGDYSFAGVFESTLNVDRSGLETAIAEVLASFGSARAKSYGVDSGGANILVQRMVDAEYAGVLFTRDPAAGGLALVELVQGTAEGLVSGAVAPQAFRCGRLSGDPVGDAKPPIDLAPLVKIGHRAEELFGAPQDIEWTYRAGRFYLVQSRDITRLLYDDGANGALQREYARVLEIAAGGAPDEVAFAQNELAEMLPRPTPLSLSLMGALWAGGGSVDLACRSLGISYGVEEDAPSYLVTIFGRLYVNKRQEQIRTAHIGPLAARRLRTGAARIEREFREHFLPRYLREMTLREAIDFDRLATADLFNVLVQLHDDFINTTHVEVDVINIAASYYFERAKKTLAEHGFDPAKYLGRVPGTVYDCALAEAGHAPREERRALLVASLGHRAVLDYELAHPRHAEAPEAVEALCDAEMHISHYADEGNDPAFAAVAKSVIEAADTACRFEALKEDAKHHSLREFALIRRVVLAIDRRLGLDGLIFYLTYEDILALRERPVAELRSLATERQQLLTQFAEATPLPPSLTIRAIEEASAGIEDHASTADGAVRGTRVSGSGVIVGRARVVPAADAERGGPIADFADGDIVVSSMVHPAWLPYFRRAGGFVCEVGGWLSHTAILAREHDLPMLVGTRGLRSIKDGSMLRLHPDGLVEIVAEGVVVSAIAAE